MDLEALGWSPFFAQQFAPFGEQGLVPGRVAIEYSQLYQVSTEQGEALATLAGRLRHQAGGRQDLPAVGDWVALRPAGDSSGARIQAVLARKSKFSRKVAGRTTEEQVVAANVDTVLLVMGLDDDFNLRRLERYLVAGRESGARPVVVLNKADLCSEVAERVREVGSIAPDIAAHPVSSLTGVDLETLQPYLGQGQTIAVLGSSGVGKSTLINRLVGQEIQRTQAVRSWLSRGRHTTTHRELIALPSGGLIVDTPGMRELQLWVAGEGYEATFEDVEALTLDCQFSDCGHGAEPGCAVQAAVDEGRLSPERLANYLKLQQELRYVERRADKRAGAAAKRRVRANPPRR